MTVSDSGFLKRRKKRRFQHRHHHCRATTALCWKKQTKKTRKTFLLLIVQATPLNHSCTKPMKDLQICISSDSRSWFSSLYWLNFVSGPLGVGPSAIHWLWYPSYPQPSGIIRGGISTNPVESCFKPVFPLPPQWIPNVIPRQPTVKSWRPLNPPLQ